MADRENRGKRKFAPEPGSSPGAGSSRKKPEFFRAPTLEGDTVAYDVDEDDTDDVWYDTDVCDDTAEYGTHSIGGRMSLFGLSRQNEPLREAAMKGDIDEAKLHLEAGADVNAWEENFLGGNHGCPLHAAAANGHVEMVKLLLEAGADVNAWKESFLGENHGCALHVAAANGHTEMVKLLLEAGADVNARGGLQRSALHEGVVNGHVEVAKVLLEAGAGSEEPGGKHGTLLLDAVTQGHVEVVKALLEAGADVNAAGGEYGSALQVAADRGHIEVLKLLLEAGADINASGGKYGSALQAGVANGRIETVGVLLEAGADVNAVGGNNEPALYVATATGNIEVLTMLLEAGANLKRSGGGYRSALREGIARGHIEVVKLLLAAGAHLHAAGEDYESVLHEGVVQGRVDVVKLLLEAGGDRKTSGWNYRRMLHKGVAQGHIEVVKLLLEVGADVNASGQDYGSVLHVAADRDRIELVEMLLEKGADVNASGRNSRSALHVAAEKGHVKVVKRLLEARADVNASGGYYGSALQAGVAQGHVEVAKLLLEAGADVNALGGYFGSALRAGVAQGYIDVVKMLLEAGADAQALRWHHGKTLQVGTAVIQIGAVMVFEGHGRNMLQTAVGDGDIELVKVLLEAGAEVNGFGENGRNALQGAASIGNTCLLEVLLEAGADVNAFKQGDASAVQLAAAKGHIGVVKVLVAAGADVAAFGHNARNSLQEAAAIGNTPVVELLLEAGADVNAFMPGYASALQLAAAKGHIEVVKVLLEAGADVNASQGVCGSALDSSIGNKEYEIIQVLLENGADVKPGLAGATLTKVISTHMNQLLRLHHSGIYARSRLLPPPDATFPQTRLTHSRRGLSDILHREVVQLLFRQINLLELQIWPEFEREHFPSCTHSGVCEVPGLAAHTPTTAVMATQLLNDPVAYYGNVEDVYQRVSVLGGLGWIRLWSNELWQDEVFSMRTENGILAVKLDDISRSRNKSILLRILTLIFGSHTAMMELQKNQFCCDSITVLVQHKSRPGVIEVIRIESNAITSFCLHLCHWWHEGDQRTRKSRSFLELYRCITAILEKVNICCPSIEILSNKQTAHFISLTAQLLCTAVHLFAGSYVNDLGIGLDTRDEKVHRIQLEGSSPAFPGLLAERRNLSCLGDMLGARVWVFNTLPEPECPANDETSKSDLLATIADVLELWGAGTCIWDKPVSEPDRRLKLVIIGGGKIAGVKRAPTSSDSEGEVMAHWTPHGDETTDYCIGLPARAKILIGMSGTNVTVPLALTYSGLKRNKRCTLNIHEVFLSAQPMLLPLGVNRSGWQLDEIQVGINGGQFFTSGVLGVWKRKTQNSLKDVMLDQWKSCDAGFLVGYWGLEVSVCTGNAIRVPLYSILRHNGVLRHIDNALGHRVEGRTAFRRSLETDTTGFLNYIRDGTTAERNYAYSAIGTALGILAYTGSEDGETLKYWFPDEFEEGILPSTLPHGGIYAGIGFLQESAHCAVFAIASPDCIEPHLPNMRGQFQSCKRSHGNSCQKELPALIMCNLQVTEKPRAGLRYRTGQRGCLKVDAVVHEDLCLARWCQDRLIWRRSVNSTKNAGEKGGSTRTKWFCIG